METAARLATLSYALLAGSNGRHGMVHSTWQCRHGAGSVVCATPQRQAVWPLGSKQGTATAYLAEADQEPWSEGFVPVSDG
jgi:hypothetical protein